MSKRIRRGTAKIGPSAGLVSIGGVRDITWDDVRETNADRSDDEFEGDIVEMSRGPVTGSFELMARDAAIDTDYFEVLEITYKEITVAAGAETSADKVATFSDGFLRVGGNVPTDGAGRLPVTFEAKTLDLS